MLQRLAEKPARSISELAHEFGISNTAASKHVQILTKTELIKRHKRGKYAQIKLATQKEISTLIDQVLIVKTIHRDYRV